MTTQNTSPSSSSSLSFLLSILSNSFKIPFKTRQFSLPIFFSLSLPLSFLTFSFSLSSRPLNLHIRRLEYLALLSHTRFEARHIWQESRSQALSLFHLKLLYYFPSAFLSLLLSISSVHSASAAAPSLLSLTKSIKASWKRVVATSICSYALSLLYLQVPNLLSSIFFNHYRLRMLIQFLGLGFEIYLMAALGLALVVSVLEDRFGWDAIRIGANVLEGTRVAGWIISAVFVAISASIGREFEGLTGSENSPTTVWAAVMRWERVALGFMYAGVIFWSYVVTTVFYCECRKKHLNILGENEAAGAHDIELS